MKKYSMLAIVLLMLFAMSLAAMAEQTERGAYTTPFSGATTWLNSNNKFLHVHEYEMYEPEIELGIIADVTLYEIDAIGIPMAIGVESQYDFNNQNWGFYGKVSLNLSPMIKGFIGQ